MTFEAVAIVAAGYLLGSIPFGLLIGWSRGVDVRARGSGNIGATNVGRVVGAGWGRLCLALDLLKGAVPVQVAAWRLVGSEPNVGELAQWLGVGVAAVLGHTFPIYLRFRGGKGVATTVGVALGMYPYFTIPMVAALLVYAAVRFATGWVSAGSLALAGTFPLAFAVYVAADEAVRMREFWPLQAASLLLAALIVLRHRDNIGRLCRGGELPASRGPEAGGIGHGV